MREFKVGDRVTIISPADREEFPYWTDEMDCFHGLRATVTAMRSVDGIPLFATEDASGYEFAVSWATPFVTTDPINHPEHYAGSNGIECIDAIRAALTPEEFRGYCKGAALKYIWRERKKGGNESLGKGVWYLNEAQK